MQIDDELFFGLMVFGLIKLAGYYFAVRWVGRYYRPHAVPSPFVVALSRIALGALFAWLVASTLHVEKSLPWYVVLVLLRTFEWGLVFWYFYERVVGKVDWNRLLLYSCFGTMASCLLDLPAAFSAFVLPLLAYGIC